MILHEIYFDGLGGGGAPSGSLADAITRDFGNVERWRTEFSAMGKAEGGGSGWVILSYSPATSGWSTSGPPTIRRPWQAGVPSSCSTCTSTPITWTTGPRPPPMSTTYMEAIAGTMR